MKNKDSKSKTSSSSKYDEAVVEKYKEFIGKKKLIKLLDKFSPKKFAGRWQQVMCSPSTSVLGSGKDFTSVQATYKLKKDGVVSVRNDAYDNDFKRVSIKGTSKAIDENIPTCRKVEFNNFFRIKGHYWLMDATPTFNTILVAAPVIVKVINTPIVVSNNFGVYVLTRDIEKFWSSPEEHQYIFNALKEYGFDKFWNKPLATAKTFDLNCKTKKSNS
jgi:lipocalin